MSTTIEDLQKQLEEEKQKRQAAEDQNKELVALLKEQMTFLQESHELMKSDVLGAHAELLEVAASNQIEVRTFITETLEMVESSLEHKLKDIVHQEAKYFMSQEASQEALKQIILQAHEELYEGQKINHQEQQNFMMESMELVERAIENKLEEIMNRQAKETKALQDSLQHLTISGSAKDH